MAKDNKTEQVKEPVVDFVTMVKEATQAHGMSSFLRVNLKKNVTDAGLEDLTEEYGKQGYEVFSNKNTVVLIKQ